MANVGESVQFRTGTYAEYLKVSPKDPNSVYFCEDTQQLFVGAVEYTRTLGDTADKAYPGDKGAVAYKHASMTSGNPHNVTKSDVGLSNVVNTKAVSVEASQGLTETEKSNARTNIGLSTVLTGGSQTSTSTADGGSNVYTFSDGSTITVKNGSKGSTGPQGPKGADATVPVIPWSTWSTLSDSQRAAYGLVVVTDQP